MKTHVETPTNARQLARLRAGLADALAEALSRGFHGTVGIEVSVQDGTIQHIRRRVERIER